MCKVGKFLPTKPARKKKKAVRETNGIHSSNYRTLQFLHDLNYSLYCY